MAEIAGLVIGGISLAAIFDQCLSIIKYVDAGRLCQDDFQDIALMLTLIGGRLNRWERTIRDNPDLQATEEDGESAGIWLKQIRRRLEEAEKLEKLFPSLDKSRVEMLSNDVAGQLESAMAKGPPKVVEALKAAAAKVDKDFEVIASSPSSHIYRNIENTDEASVSMGDYVSADFAGAANAVLPSSSHTYNGVRNSGRSVVSMGNVYGGKSIFELQY